MTEIDNVFNYYIRSATRPSHCFVITCNHFINVRNYFETLAEDENHNNWDEYAGQNHFLLLDRTWNWIVSFIRFYGEWLPYFYLWWIYQIISASNNSKNYILHAYVVLYRREAARTPKWKIFFSNHFQSNNITKLVDKPGFELLLPLLTKLSQYYSG